MRLRSLLMITVAILICFGGLAFAQPAEAHRSGCHRYHSCPSDTGSYVCGDLGYDTYCPNKRKPSETAPSAAASSLPAGNSTLPTVPRKAGESPFVDWRTFNIDARFGNYWQ